MEGILPYTAQSSFDTKSASTRYNESVSGQDGDSSKSWDSVQKAGRDLRDKIDQGASGLKDKASSAAERGKQYLDSILGR